MVARIPTIGTHRNPWGFRLRTIFTTEGPVHPTELVQRGVEANRRRLNQDDRNQIAAYVGAVWTEETRQWVYSRD
jgi:hypothetical protein